MVPPEVTASRCALGTGGQLVGHAIPDQPGPQLGEVVGRVAPGQHVEHRGERRRRQPAERRRPAHQFVHLGHGHGVHRDHGHDLLGQHVERVAGIAHRLDLTRAHPLGDHGGLDQIAAVLGEHHATRHRADLVAGPADPLQTRGHRRWRLYLDDQIDRTHVDAQLE